MKGKLIYSLCVCVFISLGDGLNAQVQNPAWFNQVDLTNSDYPFDLWVNSHGDVFEFSRIGAINNHLDGASFSKTDQTGVEIWRQNFFAASDNWQLFPKAITGDENGDIYLLFNEKYRYIDTNVNRICLSKYSSDGLLIWTKYVTDFVENRTEEANETDLTYQNGALYFSGVFAHETLFFSQGLDGVIYKVNAADGSVVFRSTYNSIFDSDDVFKECVVSQSGELHAVGRSRGYIGPFDTYSDYDAISVKFDAAGAYLWENRINGTGNTVDFGINIALDSSGNSYVSNQLKSLGINQNTVHIQKIDPNGVQVWYYTYQGASSGYIRKQPIAVNANGRIVFVTSNNDGIVTTCLNQFTGTELWTSTFSRDALGAQDYQNDMVTSEDGKIYIVGVTRDNTPMGSGTDMTTLCYDSSGFLLWEGYIDVGNYSTSGDHGLCLQWCPENQSVYVAGKGQNPNYNVDILMAKYGNGLSTVSTASMSNQTMKVSPNPFVENFTVTFPSQKSGTAILTDAQGNQLIEQRFFDNEKWTISTYHLAAGVYFLQVKWEESIEVIPLMKQ